MGARLWWFLLQSVPCLSHIHLCLMSTLLCLIQFLQVYGQLQRVSGQAIAPTVAIANVKDITDIYHLLPPSSILSPSHSQPALEHVGVIYTVG